MAFLGMQSPRAKFTVLHMRLGGSLGEAVDRFHHKDPVTIHEVVEAVACAKSFAAQKSNDSKLVFITDNIELRRLVSDKQFLPDLLCVAGTPVHWEGHKHKSLEPLLEVMADLVVMARSSCVIHNFSGFYKTALLWSGTSCTHSLQECQR